MKQLTPAALSELARQFGSEPFNLIEIDWGDGSTVVYADKELPGIKPKILSLSTVQTSVTIDAISSNQVTVTLDDTDGELKGVLDRLDVHKKRVRVYQFFATLVDTDKFSIFDGQISSPIEWGENDRQITLTLLSEVESFEVGFTPEEGQLDFVSPKRS